jgi:hypothetical protein
MGSKGDALELSVLDSVLGATAYSPPGTVYFALYSVTPGDAGGGTELADATSPGYARVAVTNNTTNFPDAASGAKTVGVDITFPTNSSGGAAWVAAVAWGILDASTGGVLMLWGAMTSLACPNAEAIVIPADTTIWTED